MYIGITDNLERRIYEHKNKLMPGFTSKYNITRLMYYEEFSRIEDAIAAEKKLKGCGRQKKLNLIRTMNPTTRDLAEDFNLEMFR